jgi:ferredoxin
VFYEKGVQNKKFFIAKAITDTDAVISLPKLKTHAFEKFTGSVKNQFGCIPGVRKGEYHIKLPDANHFAQMLVDLNNFVKPVLYVMDGIFAMEGNGPRGGKPRKMNILLFSDDPIALDATVCRLIDLNPEYVPTVTLGRASGAGTYLEDEIELAGDDFNIFRQNNFDIDRSPLKPYKAKGFMSFLNNRFVPKPFIIKEKCVACGVCISMCPMEPKSVDWSDDDKNKPPVHNYKTCIRCFCCQELCPESAIELKFPLARRIFGGKSI